MNGPEEPDFLASKLSPPRPQALGEEVKDFHEDLSCFSEHYKSSLKEMEQDRMHIDGPKADPLTCKDMVVESENFFETSMRNTSPPAPFKWAQSLQCLLEDVQGVALFEQFLKQEGHDTRSLSFWFACRGVKKTDPNDSEKLLKLINVLYDKKVKRIPAITSATKIEIQRRLSCGAAVDASVFDDAQREVEQYMLKTTYPNFLNSDLYIQHLGTVQNEPVTECLDAAAGDFLPTVHEDSELNISVNKAYHTKEAFMSRRKIALSKARPENQAGSYLKSPYGANYSCYHTKYASFLPASAQDSELQSLSSDAQTDDTMSQTDSSVDFPMHCRKQKRQQKLRYFGNVLNKDRLIGNSFIPRTQRPLGESSQVPKNPEEFHAVLVKKLCRVLEEQKSKDKFNERLKAIEAYESSKSDGFLKTVPKLEPCNQNQGFLNLCGPSEDNVQDILDQHVSRVFEDTGLTPVMSPGCVSPPVAKRDGECSRLGFPPADPMPQDLSYTSSQRPQSNVVPYNIIRFKRDHDTRSSDSGALTDYISEDNLPTCHRMSESGSNPDATDYTKVRSREQLRRHISKKLSSMTDSSSSCVDSGISVACEPSHSKVTHWLETKRCSSEYEKEHIWKTSSTSPVLSRSSSTRKAVIYNSGRSGALDAVSSPWQLVPPSQPLMDPSSTPSMPPPLPPDTTNNLIEARRRLEDESRIKMGKSKYTSGGRSSHDNIRGKVSSRACDSIEEGISHRKQSKKSSLCLLDSSASSVTTNDVTIIGYSYGRGSVPYKSRLPGKNITLRQFKSLLNKKGNFRYFFKRISDDFGTGVVLEEVIDDYEVLPLWEGKVFCVIEAMEDCPAPNEE